MLADSRAHVRASLKTALTHAGLENVDQTGSLDAVIESVDQGLGPDLLICDMALKNGEACDLIQSIRQNEIGKNPFLCVLGITWNPTEPEVQKVIDSGVDLLVAAPMSPKQVLSRVEALVHARIPFAVTSDYIGPDRRKDYDQREQTIPLMEVPNTLQSKALGTWNQARMEHEIRRAAAEIRVSRVERQADDIAQIAEMIFNQANDATLSTARAQLDRLYVLVSNLDRRAGQQGFGHISELCQACVGVVRKLIAGDGGPAEKDLLLLRQLALAIRKSMRPDEGETAIVHDIARTVIAAR
jgi:DNA-binding response OmpR family regulator